MRISGYIGIVIFAAGSVLAPVAAEAGFFESLFGLAPTPTQQAVAPTPQASPTLHPRRRAVAEPQDYILRRVHKKSKTASTDVPKSSVSAETPVLQRTTGLLDDATLRVGDAVMTKDGIRVFSGPTGAHHGIGDFVPLRNARHVKRVERVALASIDDTARKDVGRDRRQGDVLTGRSVGAPAEERRPSFDDPHVTVRYVGP